MRLVRVFDLGDVLIHVDEDLFCQRLRARCRPGAPVEETLDRHLDEAAVDTGGDFDSIHPLLVRDLGLTMTLAELRLAWNDIFSPMPDTLDLVRQSPRPRCLLSNTNEPHVTWLRERYASVLDLFDHRFLSCEVGLRKPDPALFRHVETVTQQPPGGHVLVDDIPQNVAAARAAGWLAVHFQGAADCRRRLVELDSGPPAAS